MKQINSELPIEHDILKIKWGTTNKKQPVSIYLELGAYITPDADNQNYADSIKKINKSIKEKVRELVTSTNLIYNDFIFVPDIADGRITFGKKSYLSFQIHMVTNQQEIGEEKEFKDIVSDMDSLWSSLYEEILSVVSENGFSCSKTK